jgi:hypothetical protein
LARQALDHARENSTDNEGNADHEEKMVLSQEGRDGESVFDVFEMARHSKTSDRARAMLNYRNEFNGVEGDSLLGQDGTRAETCNKNAGYDDDYKDHENDHNMLCVDNDNDDDDDDINIININININTSQNVDDDD